MESPVGALSGDIQFKPSYVYILIKLQNYFKVKGIVYVCVCVCVYYIGCNEPWLMEKPIIGYRGIALRIGDWYFTPIDKQT